MKSSPSVLPGHFRPDLSQLVVLLSQVLSTALLIHCNPHLPSCYSCPPGAGHPPVSFLLLPSCQGMVVLHHNVPLWQEHPRGAKDRGSKNNNIKKKYKKYKGDAEIPTIDAKHLK